MSTSTDSTGSLDYGKKEREALRMGGLSALMAGTADYLMNRKQKNTKKRLLRSALVGLGVGGVTTLGKTVYDNHKLFESYKNTGRIPFGFTSLGSGTFDPNSPVEVVEDENGNPTISLYFRGIRGHIDTGLHNASELKDRISEQVSGSIVGSKHLQQYIDRVQKASDDWAATHDGQRPKLRLIGHSRGGPATLRFAQELKNRASNLTVDDIIALDPVYVTAFDRLKSKGKDLANNIYMVRPQLSGSNKFQRAMADFFGSNPLMFRFASPDLESIDVPGATHTDDEKMLPYVLDWLKNRKK